MALEPKIAGEKWRRFHQDERVEPRSLIKSNWETSIWYRVYSPEKINRELQRGLGGLWERAGRSPAGRRQAWPARTHSLAASPLLEAGEGQPASEATTHCGCLTVSAREESSQGRHCTTSKCCAFFSVLKCAWSAKHHFFPRFSRPLFPLTSPPHLTTALVNFLKLRAFPAFSIWVVFDGRSFQELTERISPPLPRGKFSWFRDKSRPEVSQEMNDSLFRTLHIFNLQISSFNGTLANKKSFGDPSKCNRHLIQDFIWRQEKGLNLIFLAPTCWGRRPSFFSFPSLIFITLGRMGGRGMWKDVYGVSKRRRGSVTANNWNESTVFGTVYSEGRDRMPPPLWGHSQLFFTSRFVK